MRESHAMSKTYNHPTSAKERAATKPAQPLIPLAVRHPAALKAMHKQNEIESREMRNNLATPGARWRRGTRRISRTCTPARRLSGQRENRRCRSFRCLLVALHRLLAHRPQAPRSADRHENFAPKPGESKCLITPPTGCTTIPIPSRGGLKSAPVKPGEVVMTKARHRAELQELGDKHRAAHAQIELDRNKSLARSGGMTDDYSDSALAQKSTPRDKLAAKHADERSALLARHSRELADAKKRNPAP
jgi:hypothetical protein